jgi:hypothetical protein
MFQFYQAGMQIQSHDELFQWFKEVDESRNESKQTVTQRAESDSRRQIKVK